MNKMLILALLLSMAGFGVWSLFVGSRYQTLCELSYWSATKEELKHCDERAQELR